MAYAGRPNGKKSMTRIGSRKVLGIAFATLALAALILSGAEAPLLIIGLIVIVGFLVTNFLQFSIWRMQRERLSRARSAGLSYTESHGEPEVRKAVGQVEAITRRLWGGFHISALEQLNSYVRDGTVPNAAKSVAHMELGRWYGANQDHTRAYVEILKSRLFSARLPLKRQNERIALEIDFLTEMREMQEAKHLLESTGVLERRSADYLLRLANVDSDPEEKLKRLNEIYARSGLATVYSQGPLELGNLSSGSRVGTIDGPKVSVVMPAYNAEKTIGYAMGSVLAQTWRNIELIVIDDASADSTGDIAKEIAARDSRVIVLEQSVNGGPYIARNRAASIASGEYITVHDSDDWAHPEKLARQAQDLEDNPQLMANMTHHVRIDTDFRFLAPTGRPRETRVSVNLSSLMLRRSVLGEIGLWDEVRSGGDSELRSRLVSYYGQDAVGRVLHGVPLGLSLSTKDSLISNPRSGQRAMHYVAGARRIYADLTTEWHSSSTFRESLPFDPSNRPFVVPQAIDAKPGTRLGHFDVIIVSNFGLPGGTTSSNIQEITAHQRNGWKTGLLHHPIADWNIRRSYNARVLDVIDPELTKILSVGDAVSCDLLILRLPKIGERLLDVMPYVEAKRAIVVMNQTPDRTYGFERDAAYDLNVCVPNIEKAFGPGVKWYPIGPLIRSAVEQHHAHQLSPPTLSDTDWYNIIDLDFWRRSRRRERDGITRIGRHSRDAELKWPEDRKVLQNVYPTSAPYEVHILGGAEVPVNLLGGLPDNWQVYGFGEMEPHEFLKDIDVYVYFTHSGLVEAFGRGLLEALAVGVPVVTSPEFEPLLGDAAIYASPENVRYEVDRLMRDDEHYQRQVRRGYQLIESRFSFQSHIDRVEALKSGQDRVGRSNS